MRLARIGALALLMGPWAAAAEFAAPPPQPIAGFGRFQVLGGELDQPQLKAGYRFYVDPARAALFTVMRYRLRGSGAAPSPTEKFVWNERPGARVPLRCFEWVETSDGGEWREMPSSGAAYRSEMLTLMQVLAEQNRAYQRHLEPEGRQP
jgi:hypothetical protein